MRGIKRPCRLVIMTCIISDNGAINTGSVVSQHESITDAKKSLEWQRSYGEINFSKIIPDKVKE